MWMRGLGTRGEAELWLKALLCSFDQRDQKLADGNTKTKLRPIALLETPRKLIESIAVHLVVDHIVALMQTRQVGFRVQDGAEAVIGAVRRFLKDRQTGY